MANLKTVRTADDQTASDAFPLYGSSPNLYARVHVANRHQIEAAFGEDAAIAVLTAVHDRAAALAGPVGFVSWRTDGLDLFFNGSAHLSSLAACNSTRAITPLQHELKRNLSGVVDVRGLALFPLISVAVAALDSSDGLVMGAVFARAQADPCMTLLSHPNDDADIADPPFAIVSLPPRMRLRGIILALPISVAFWAAIIAAWHYFA